VIRTILQPGASKLVGVTDSVSLGNPNGNILGYNPPAEDKPLNKDLMIPCTREERRERDQERRGYAIAELLEHHSCARYET
jgi:hypothetical protein